MASYKKYIMFNFNKFYYFSLDGTVFYKNRQLYFVSLFDCIYNIIHYNYICVCYCSSNKIIRNFTF